MTLPDPEGDLRDGTVYVYNDEIKLAVNVGLATGRPLLVRGAPGSGKSSLAASVAAKLGWRYYEKVVTSRTEARDLLWRFDTVRRFSDANANTLKPAEDYIQPGVLWWAFDPESARYRGLPLERRAGVRPLRDPGHREHERAVVLIDEIDKADPDVPNNLLVELGSRRFMVYETGVEVGSSHVPFIVITTNNERALPDAFLRRCVVLSLPDPDPRIPEQAEILKKRLIEVGKAHLNEWGFEAIREAAADKVLELGRQARERRTRGPSTAEYLDLLWACKHLNIAASDDARWAEITAAALWKHVTAADAKTPAPDEGEL